MFSSPITSWENVSAYFTFADSPTGIAISLAAAVGLYLFLNASIMKHEKEAFDKHL
ncbi:MULTISPECIES: hypothetical protein [Marinobacterium]|jgi:hypothetical protein|uniref:Uncharacterized protein n=1 Tax=Marinobacterium iners DSM 11526 TaxID=1122198 RepID=A0A1H4FMU1_9GAMM|nr:hypothetical protein [Marinobacterium iners]SEA98693.1 hypothetical protein SAMN02745729_11214 [Marinobacterium iners DSM 11526]